MGFNEFKELSGALNGWKQNFVTMDRDSSGTIEAQELQQALSSMGRNRCFCRVVLCCVVSQTRPIFSLDMDRYDILQQQK